MATRWVPLVVWVHVVVLAGCAEPEDSPGTTARPSSAPASSQPAAALPATAPADAALFPGDTLSGWRVSHWSGVHVPQHMPGKAWSIQGGVLRGLGKRTWLFSEAVYDDFVLTFDVKISRGANGGIGLRFPPKGDPAYTGMELQVVDHAVYYRGRSRPEQRTGSIYDEIASTADAWIPPGQWSTWRVTANGSRVTVEINSKRVLGADLSRETHPRQGKGPALAKRPLAGRIGFQNLNGLITFRNVRLQRLRRARQP